MKLATKLTIIVLTMIIIISGGITYLGYRAGIKALENEVIQGLENTAFHIMDKIDRMQFERLANIEIIAGDPIISSRDSTPIQISNRLEEYQKHFKDYLSLSLFALNRTRIADSTGLDIGERHPLNGYWKDDLIGKSFTMSIYESISLRGPVINFTYPVKDKNGEVLGIVVTRMPISKLRTAIEGNAGLTRGNEELHVDLIDKEGVLLYSNTNENGILKDNLSGYEAARRCRGGEERGSGNCIHCDGRETIYVFVGERGYLDYPGNDWTLIIHVSAKTALAPIVILRNKKILILAVTLVLSAFIILILSRTITRSLAKLQEDARIIGSGNLNHRVGLTTGDEIGELSRSFDKMARDLISQMEKRGQAEEKLRTSEDQLSNAMEIAKLGYWEYDVADDLFTFNDHFYSIFRTTAEEVGGYTMSSVQYAELFLHPDDRQVVNSETKKAVENIDPHYSRQLKHRIIYADGEIGYISVRIFIVKDDQGHTVKTYGISQDITERKRAEKELKKYSEKLEEMVDKRTAELKERIDELERFHDATVERELRIKRLREEVERLQTQIQTDENTYKHK